MAPLLQCPDQTMFAPETTIDERFTIVSALGAGGFGTVFKARQNDLHRMVALKFLNYAQGLSTEARLRLEQEALALSRLRHERIVGIYGLGMLQDQPYLIMEYVEGASLLHYMRRHSKLSEEVAVAVVSQILEGLSVVHEQGIIHRDLKPANVLITNADDASVSVKILDFGLAKLSAQIFDVQKMTATGSAVGTVEYMSPEQCTGQPVDLRSDIYAVGAMLYFCLTGSSPFIGKNEVEVMEKQMFSAPPELPSSKGDKRRAALQAVIYKAMAKNPADRYASAAEMMAEISDCNLGTGSRVLKDRLKLATGQIVTPGRKRHFNIAVAVGCLVSLALAALVLTRTAEPLTSRSLYAKAKYAPPESRIELLRTAIEMNNDDGKLDGPDYFKAVGDLITSKEFWKMTAIQRMKLYEEVSQRAEPASVAHHIGWFSTVPPKVRRADSEKLLAQLATIDTSELSDQEFSLFIRMRANLCSTLDEIRAVSDDYRNRGKEDLKLVYEIKTDEMAARVTLARVFARLGDAAESEKYVQEVEERYSPRFMAGKTVLLAAVRTEVELGHWEKAALLAEKITEPDSRDARVAETAMIYGMIAHEMAGKHETVLSLFDKFKSVGTDSMNGLKILCDCMDKQGHHADAERYRKRLKGLLRSDDR